MKLITRNNFFDKTKANNIINKNYKKLEYKKPTKNEKYWISWKSTFTFIIIGILTFGIGFTFFNVVAKKRKKITKNVLPNLSSIWLESISEYLKTYKDVKTLKKTSKNIKEIISRKENKGIGIPSDAEIIDYSCLPEIILVDKKGIIMAESLWYWQRSNGKSTTTYYKKFSYAFVNGAPNKIVNENIKIIDNNILRSTGVKLENDYFNKQFSPYFKNQLIGRMLLTPFAQQNLLDLKKQGKLKKFTFKTLPNDKLIMLSIRINNNDFPYRESVPVKGLTSYENALKQSKNAFLKDIKIIMQSIEVLGSFNVLF